MIAAKLRVKAKVFFIDQFTEQKKNILMGMESTQNQCAELQMELWLYLLPLASHDVSQQKTRPFKSASCSSAASEKHWRNIRGKKLKVLYFK